MRYESIALTPLPAPIEPQFTLRSNIPITPKLECSHMLGKGNPGTNIPIHPTDSDYDDTPDRNNMHLQTLKPQVRTPDRGFLLTSSLITPPDSVERPPAPIPSFPQHVLPQHVFPPIPRTMSELTPSLLSVLSRCLTYSPDFPHQNSDHAIAISNVTTQKCMPTPIHENIANYGTQIILEAISTYTGMSTYDPGMFVRVYHNVEIETTGDDGSGSRIPDLSIKVRLHPPEADLVFTGIVWEIGVSQTLASLKRRARMWLSNVGIKEDVRIHLVVLVHVFEEEAPEEYLDENGEVVMSRAKAARMKWDWPNEWFGNRGLVEEVNRRGGMKKSVKEELKRDIRLRLLEEDDSGRLIPLLMEPLGAELIVYRRREDVGQDQNSSEEHDSDSEQGSSGESSGEQGSSGEQDSDREQDSVLEQDSDSSEQSLNHLAGVESNISSDSRASFASSSDSADEESDDSDAALGIYQINSIPLMHNDAPLRNLSSAAFSIRIAELYGPLHAGSHILNKIPPILRPHANEKIYFPLETLAETVLLDGKAMRSRRASDRARGIVDRAWADALTEKERLKAERQRVRVVADRDGRRVGRGVRKMAEVGSGPGEEAEAEGERGGDRRQKRVRAHGVGSN
ncbi:hypothetical protein L211DRAFT_868495 [Terfezia boudieri ATCC MYA-4762]|uniref:Uncharacterized protein n=1 Tax=Terfezia boudieri ATCC MYA-4762 TaxID=1051890 RepID=A0A3N4LL98_9PEZI|nr:hypothetical protein L211DRAFT_868495 [Terfezia boudieri ATCC MYA-4762]